MPTPEQILAGLTNLANQYQWVAVFWHLYFALLAISLAVGVRPPQRVGAALLALPLLSVSILAWLTGNPFNGLLFALAGIALLWIAFRMSPAPVTVAPGWLVGIGALLFAFGWLYPHFLNTTSFVPYLYAAPTGLIPCPTLSIVIGLSLMVEGFQSRAWSLTLGGAGIFYGLFGTLRLGVTIDWVLFVGALLLVALVFLPKTTLHRQALAH